MKPTNTIGWIARVLCVLTCLYYLAFALGGSGIFDNSYAMTPQDLMLEALLLLSIASLLIGFRYEIEGGLLSLLCVFGYFIFAGMYMGDFYYRLASYGYDFTLILFIGLTYLVAGVELKRINLHIRK